MIRKISDVLKIISFFVFLFLIIKSPLAEGQTAKVFLDLDTNYIISQYDTLFSVDVKVDENADSLHAFKVYFSFDENIITIPSVVETTIVGPDTTIDTTLMVEEGPLLSSSGHSTTFRVFFLSPDSNSIQFDDVIWGAYWVNGPGVLATIYFKPVGQGISDLIFDSLTLVGITGGTNLDTIPSAAVNGIGYIDVPPTPFDLIGPPDSSEYKPHENPEDSSIMLDWEDAETVYPGDTILYTLEYSTSENFHPDSTNSVENINGSEYELYIDTFTVTSLIYWRVKAFDIYGLETWSNPPHLRFIVSTYICGDVNSDGTIDLTDVICLANYCFGKPCSIIPQASDVNCDSSIDLPDVISIARYTFGQPIELNCCN